MLEKVLEIINDFVDVDLDTADENTRLRGELGLNSFDFVNVAIELEREFGVKIPDSAAANLRTVGELVELVKTLQGEAAKKEA
ncbi:MAG: acyl carrier protein [Clostridia bacterium]|nr:acyl carrier protein [Clostridia bacterium]